MQNQKYYTNLSSMDWISGYRLPSNSDLKCDDDHHGGGAGVQHASVVGGPTGGALGSALPVPSQNNTNSNSSSPSMLGMWAAAVANTPLKVETADHHGNGSLVGNSVVVGTLPSKSSSSSSTGMSAPGSIKGQFIDLSLFTNYVLLLSHLQLCSYSNVVAICLDRWPVIALM
ncbi:unnamed protein product [Lepeophtheirus salmonis]|uniref:(salmon louse) hypothetical protein n=1 Tax=Lepeophtheirus salmonis TaxID=72036 RepID=A0A7R8GZZ3_LEPSM|nr:unnamed protein product [Lepeophtheirus salmonis]CAF2760308.1 unnamed protein product [Lepeophtheirus salmonis]